MVFFNLEEKFKLCLSVTSFVTRIPRYLTEDFTGISLIILSFKLCKGRISHLDKFRVRPEALEKILMKEIAVGIRLCHPPIVKF